MEVGEGDIGSNHQAGGILLKAGDIRQSETNDWRTRTTGGSIRMETGSSGSSSSGKFSVDTPNAGTVGLTDNDSGAVTLTTGNAIRGESGSFTLATGNVTKQGSSGNFTVRLGEANGEREKDGGWVSLHAGATHAKSASGGSVEIKAGEGLSPLAGGGGGSGGSVSISGGTSKGRHAQFDHGGDGKFECHCNLALLIALLSCICVYMHFTSSPFTS